VEKATQADLLAIIQDSESDLDDVRRVIRSNRGLNLNTALLEAAGINKRGLVELLIELGANIKTTDADGNTALHVAAKTEDGIENIIDLLTLRPRPNANAKNKNGTTPLMFAVENGIVETVGEFIKCPGIQVNLKDNRGRTALDYLTDATNSNTTDKIVTLLCEKGAKHERCPEIDIGELELPSNAENEITKNHIKPGTNMVNFHEEYEHGRYYTKNTFDKFANPKRNPMTRELIKKTRIYKAKEKATRRRHSL